MEENNWQRKNEITGLKNEKDNSFTQQNVEKDQPKSFSTQISNANRKTQFSLGNYKGSTKSEASSHYQPHMVQIDKQSVPNTFEVKKHHFSLGNYKHPYETTNSASFVGYNQTENKQLINKPTGNIWFGGDKAKMTSIGHSEFISKKTDQISKETMGKIKENHRAAHFFVGSIEPNYVTTSNQYKITNDNINPAKIIKPAPTKVVFGTYRAALATEKQENFGKKKISVLNSDEIKNEMRKSHFFIGKEKSVPLPTSLDSYQGKQQNENLKFFGKDYKTSINLGNSFNKWESSYQQNFSTRSITPYENSKRSNDSTIIFGNYHENRISTAKDSFQGHKKDEVKPSAKETPQNNSFSLGDFKRKFDTSNNSYGKVGGKPSTIDKEILSNITACHFSYGNDKRELKSKFQEDFGAVPKLPEKVNLKENSNKASNLSFGDKVVVWESTYKKAFIK